MEGQLELLDRLYAGLKLKDAVYSEKTNTCVVNFLYNPESFKPDNSNKSILLQKLKEIIGDFVKIDVNFINCPLDKRAIANHTYSTIINTFPALNKNFSFDDVSVEIEDITVKIKLKLSPSIYEYATNLNREKLIAEKLKESFLADFVVEFVKKEANTQQTDAIKDNIEFMASIKSAEEKTVYELAEVTDIIGKNDYTLASDFSKINSPVENIAICGEVTNVQRKSYTKSFTKNGVKKDIEHIFYNFTLKNEGKFLYCSIFPKQSDENKGDLIEIGMKVCCFGSFRMFNNKLNFTANSIARCEYKKEEVKAKAKTVNENYHTVFPQKYIDYEQSGLFDETEKTFPGSYVVFDLETTGTEANKDAIIEIGACKIVDGQIKETFSTFVNPERHIPADASRVNNIYDNMVADAPTINYVLPDFYKFCHDSTLVGQNVSFDIGFIYNVSKKLSYNFDNPLEDTLQMARKKLPGLKNYKLGTIVEKLNISLENAHRALNDAIATAKVFIKLK